MDKYRKDYDDSPSTLIIEVMKQNGRHLHPLLFANAKLNTWSNVPMDEVIVYVKKLVCLLGAALEYSDPNEITPNDLKLVKKTTVRTYLESNNVRELVIPTKDEWEEGLYNRFRLILNLKPNETSQYLLIKQERLLNEPNYAIEDFTKLYEDLNLDISGWSCPVGSCKRDVKTRNRARHLNEVHNIYTPFRCLLKSRKQICGLRFERKKDRKLHEIEIHSNLFRCQYCYEHTPIEFNHKSEVFHHQNRNDDCWKKLKSDFPKLKRRYTCYDNIDDHPNLKKFVADSKKHYNWHIEYYHEKKYSDEQNIDLTLYLISPVSNNIFRVACPYGECIKNRKGETKKRIFKHLREVHKLEFSMQCNCKIGDVYCFEKFRNKAELGFHRREKHSMKAIESMRVVYFHKK